MSEIEARDRECFTLPQRVYRALEETDGLPPALKECVHEYGSSVVRVIMKAGVTDARHIHNIVHACWTGALQPHQRQDFGYGKYYGSPVMHHLDWILAKSGAHINAATLLRILWKSSMVILPRHPGTVMVNASMATYNGGPGPRVSKEQKHEGRLRAAIEAQAARLWPHLFRK